MVSALFIGAARALCGRPDKQGTPTEIGQSHREGGTIAKQPNKSLPWFTCVSPFPQRVPGWSLYWKNRQENPGKVRRRLLTWPPPGTRLQEPGCPRPVKTAAPVLLQPPVPCLRAPTVTRRKTLHHGTGLHPYSKPHSPNLTTPHKPPTMAPCPASRDLKPLCEEQPRPHDAPLGTEKDL